MSISAKKALTKKGRSDEVIREHKPIVEALSQRIAKKVEEAIKKHLIKSKLAALECHDNE